MQEALLQQFNESSTFPLQHATFLVSTNPYFRPEFTPFQGLVNTTVLDSVFHLMPIFHSNSQRIIKRDTNHVGNWLPPKRFKRELEDEEASDPNFIYDSVLYIDNVLHARSDSEFRNKTQSTMGTDIELYSGKVSVNADGRIVHTFGLFDVYSETLEMTLLQKISRISGDEWKIAGLAEVLYVIV